jgi:hypothetical protein
MRHDPEIMGLAPPSNAINYDVGFRSSTTTKGMLACLHENNHLTSKKTIRHD